MPDYSKYLPYLDDSVDTLLENFKSNLLRRTTPQRCREIVGELRVYLTNFKRIKESQPDKIIDDHVGAILCSYEINPELDIMNRDAHYNGCWYALWGDVNKLPREKVKAKCATIRPFDVRWTEMCLKAVDEFYDTYGIEHKDNLINRLRYKKSASLLKV